MNDVRKTGLTGIGRELETIFDRLGRIKTAINFDVVHTPEHSQERLDKRNEAKAVLDAQDHIIGAIFEIAKITG